MWEYKREEYKFKTHPELLVELNKEGKDGWEIANYQEEKAPKFGGDITTKILYKRQTEMNNIL